MISLAKPLAALSILAQRRATSYLNPVIPGDFPDPTIVRVGERDFYLATTSTDWAPEFPIFHSRDLITWTLVGSVFSERPSWSVGNFWAPEFAEFNGRFYIYYVARRKAGPLCVAVASSANPAGPYTDHGPLVGQNNGSIDPMATVDEHGDPWLIWKEDGNSAHRPTPIWAQRLRADGLSLVGEKHELFRNDAPWEGDVVEAPVVVRRDGWFYILYAGNACCGCECAYAVGAARSRSLLGPWEKCPRNPILSGNEAWRCPGHGSVTVDAAGRTFFVYHGYALASDSVYVGRQVLLDEVTWDESGWPVINGGRGPSRVARAPFGPRRERRETPFVDTFGARELQVGYQWPQTNAPRITLRRGEGVELAAAAHLTDPLGGVLARSVSTGDYTASAAIDLHGLQPGVLASLTAYGDRKNALGIGVRNGRIVVWRRKRGTITVVESHDLPSLPVVHVRVTAYAGHMYRFAFGNGKTWTESRHKVDGAYLPPWDRGVRVALTAGGVAGGASARFKRLRIARTGRTITDLQASKAGFERHRTRMRRIVAKPA